MTNLTIPYASRAPFIRDDETPRLMQLAGQQRAEGMRRGGDIWGGAINSLGQLASGTITQIAEQKRADQMAKSKAAAEAPILADQAKLRSLTIEKTQSELDAAKADRERQVKVGGAILGGGKRAQILEALKSDPQAYQMASEALDRQDTSLRRHFGELGATIRSFKDSPEAALLQLDLAEEDGFDPAKLAPLREMIKKDPKSVTGLVDSLLAKSGVPEFQKMVTPEAKAQEPFSLSPGQVRYGPDGKVIASAPREPKEPRVENKMWVMRPGEDGKLASVFIPESQVRAGDVPSNTRAGEGRPSTGAEKRVLNFFNRAKQADEELSKLGEVMSGKSLIGQTYQATAPNFMQTQEGQSYIAAQRAFTEARLRKDSGAAIPEQEFKNDRQTYFQQPGDSPETLKQKERARAAILSSLAFESGRALGEFYGDEADSFIEQYKARQSGAAPSALPTPPAAKKTPTEGGWITVGGVKIRKVVP